MSFAKTGLVLVLLCAAGCAQLRTSSSSASGKVVSITTRSNRLTVEFDGQLFTEYFYKDVPRPYCYPVLGPGHVPVTRHWPLEDIPGEEHDHPHHRSFWYTHGDVNGVDFWTEAPGAGKIVHRRFKRIQSSGGRGVIESENDWVAADGRVICRDTRMLTFQSAGGNYFVDFDITLHPEGRDLVLGDTKEGTMAIRVAETMRVTHGKQPGAGHIVTSAGDRDVAAWGKRAAWCDYYGPVENSTQGIAIFDHPNNPRHPTWWHVRDYGLFAANPFGVHEFEKKPAGTGALVVLREKTVTFRYRFVFHEGSTESADVAGLYSRYVNETR
jgi:hypothetical protein